MLRPIVIGLTNRPACQCAKHIPEFRINVVAKLQAAKDKGAFLVHIKLLINHGNDLDLDNCFQDL